MVHGDLKPGNVLVTASGEPRVCDFDHCRDASLGARTVAGRAAGAQRSVFFTPGYAAPELRETGTATRASDVFAVGRMLEQLLRDLDTRGVGGGGDGGAVPAAFRALARAMVDADPARRPSAMAALAMECFGGAVGAGAERRGPHRQ